MLRYMTADGSHTPERQTRNTERTRRAILNAAAKAISEKGAAITVAKVANLAGVSKSGLLHHFSNKEELIAAVVADANDHLRALVTSNLDLSENHPGKMLRAFVRTLCTDSEEVTQFFTSSPLWNGIATMPAIADVLREDSQWWTEQFTADGLSFERVLIVRRAAEGIAAAAGYGEETSESLSQARELLLKLATDGDFGSPN